MSVTENRDRQGKRLPAAGETLPADTDLASRIDIEFARYLEMRDAVRKATGSRRRAILQHLS